MFERHYNEYGMMGVLSLTAAGYDRLGGLPVDSPIRFDKRVIEEFLKHHEYPGDYNLRPLIESCGYSPDLGLKIRTEDPIYSRYFCLTLIPIGNWYRIHTEQTEEMDGDFYESVEQLYPEEWMLAR